MLYDIIGDIHGHASRLEALLAKLGYENRNGAWRHAERAAIFVGDFVDRGPEQLRTIEIARRMVDAGSAMAVMGNHEYNAIAWHTPSPHHPGDYLRSRFHPRWSPVNRRQHAAFLAEVEQDPSLHNELIEWFLSLPLWIDLPGIRVVHACWHSRYMEWLRPHLRDGRYLTRDLMIAAAAEPDDYEYKDSPEPSFSKALDTLLKGIEVNMPPGHSFTDKDGNAWHRMRVRWWDSSAVTYRDAAMLPPGENGCMPDTPLPAHLRLRLDEKPTLFGHYWLSGPPAIQSTHMACVDYSVAKGGPLVAYRHSGEPVLNNANLTWV